MRPDDLLDLFTTDPASAAPPAEPRREPRFERGPALIGFDERAPPDSSPQRQPMTADPSSERRRRLPLGVFGSLAVHFAPLLLLVGWTAAPTEIAAPIPVRLVMETPPPPLPAPAPEPTPAALGRLASVDMGEPTPPRDAAMPPPTPPPQRQHVATLVPPPKPPPPPRSLPPLPDTVPPPSPSLQFPPAKPPKPAPRKRVMPENPPHPGRVPGPDATRNEYLAYLVALTRRQLYLLPATLVGDRHGQTTLGIRVLGDGTIARIGVVQSSGYPDIDARIERVVAAVGRFPPLPQWFQGPSMELTFRLRFPEALEE